MSKRKMKTDLKNEPAVKKGHWAQGLVASMEDPELKVREDEKVVVIRDKFPKAEYHYLVLPKENIPSILSLTKEHEELMEHMEKIGTELADSHKDRKFNIGYHAVPNMQRLHLHVISTDFNSPCLKTKVHWNSFTSRFFLLSQAVREDLRRKGKIKKISNEECEKLLKAPLKCHKCSATPKNMPELKRHIAGHFSDK